MNRPKEWSIWDNDERMAWLRSLVVEHNGGRRPRLTVEDKDRVWALVRRHNNNSLVAEITGVSRRTIIRFVKRFPIPDTFEIEENVEDYYEIRTWINRQRGYSKERYIKQYLWYINRFHNWQREHHPERTRPRLWTSDDILEWVSSFPDYQQYEALSVMRQLAKKDQKDFSMIDLSLMPLRKFDKKRRSLAGRPEYYLSVEDIRRLKANVPDCDIYRKNGKLIHRPVDNPALIKARNKAILSWLFNIAIRTGSHTTEKGLLGIRIENLHLDEHWARVQDKGDIWWHVKGLCNDLILETKEYLQLRGNPTEGWLFVNDKGKPMNRSQVNGMLGEAGTKADISGKVLSCKSFRKSLVKHALEILKMNLVSLVGTGKNPKTCFCVGWDIKVLLQHYTPEMEKTIEHDRRKFAL